MSLLIRKVEDYMTIDLSGQQKLLTVRLDGELDHCSAAAVRESVEEELRKTGAVNVAFDFSAVTFMDSSGIGLILGRYKTVRGLGGRIILFGMSREIERIMRMSGIDRIAEIY
ncbi:MAG: anti-sigma factor antagonist [Clostridia bacterium]|nr:anti-sigma factor antagonist [Clostridia bacterium]